MGLQVSYQELEGIKDLLDFTAGLQPMQQHESLQHKGFL